MSEEEKKKIKECGIVVANVINEAKALQSLLEDLITGSIQLNVPKRQHEDVIIEERLRGYAEGLERDFNIFIEGCEVTETKAVTEIKTIIQKVKEEIDWSLKRPTDEFLEKRQMTVTDWKREWWRRARHKITSMAADVVDILEEEE